VAKIRDKSLRHERDGRYARNVGLAAAARGAVTYQERVGGLCVGKGAVNMT